MGLLNEQQISMIRLWELPADLAVDKPRVQVKRQTMSRLFDEFITDPALRDMSNQDRGYYKNNAPGYEKLQLLFSVGANNPQARKLYGQVIVQNEPEPLVKFRRTIHNVYVLRYFKEYFGDGKVKGLRLAGVGNDKAVAYTNFFILSQYKDGEQVMIDRLAPEHSLLLQWGLPRELAIYPAPEVPGWKPFFADTDADRYQDYLAWIDSLYKNAGDYGIDYQWITAMMGSE